MKDFAVVKADLLKSLEKMEIDGENFYKKNLSYLEGYVSCLLYTSDAADD